MYKNVWLTPYLWIYLHQEFPARRWSFFGPGSEKKCYSTYIDRPRREWDRVAEWMMIKFGESGHPVFRGTSPLSRGTLKSKGGGQLSIHFCTDGCTIETVCRTIISVGQLSFYGAVSDLCDECKASQARTVRPVLAGQSDPLFVPANSFYKERVEKLSQQDRVIKICTGAGFLTTVEVGQYFMTKAHWRVLTICRTGDMSWVHFAKEWKFIWT